MRVVLDDLGADVIKTGMLGTTACIQAVVQALDAYAPSVPVVVDPVMRAKGGHALLQDSAVRCLIDHLLPRATLVTPNVPEAEVLVGYSITTPDDMARAALDILAMGPRAVVMKGGHLPGDALVDVLVVQAGSQQAQRNFLGQRHHSRHTHGTGCTLASAIAARLACGDTLAQAVQVARDYVEKAIAAAPGFGQGHGPLGHGHPLNTAGT
jgi:hydroxymethylpyrimidine/phosphomethylpyrimidine kinase